MSICAFTLHGRRPLKENAADPFGTGWCNRCRQAAWCRSTSEEPADVLDWESTICNTDTSISGVLQVCCDIWRCVDHVRHLFEARDMERGDTELLEVLIASHGSERPSKDFESHVFQPTSGTSFPAGSKAAVKRGILKKGPALRRASSMTSGAPQLHYFMHFF